MNLKVSKKDISDTKKQRLYLIEFRDDTGYYIKCGKSSGIDSSTRLITIMESYISAHHGKCAYAKILRDVEVTEVFKRETEFHLRFKERRHYPEHSFSGFTELFSLDKEEALKAFDEIVGKQYSRELTKECYTCKVVKSTIDFHTNSLKKDGLAIDCKQCVKDKQWSFNMLPYRIYKNQELHSKTRGHTAPQYTYEEFKAWLLVNPKYKELYDAYKTSNYKTDLVPSIDRLDSTKGYSFDNIELVTFKENMQRNGVNLQNTLGKKVCVVNKYSGEVIGEFKSQNLAAMVLGISSKKIGMKVDKILTYGWLATIGDYQVFSKDKECYFTSNGYLKEEYRYKYSKKEKI